MSTLFILSFFIYFNFNIFLFLFHEVSSLLLFWLTKDDLWDFEWKLGSTFKIQKKKKKKTLIELILKYHKFLSPLKYHNLVTWK